MSDQGYLFAVIFALILMAWLPFIICDELTPQNWEDVIK